MTTREPGPSDVFTAGFTFNPSSTAFLANRAAAKHDTGIARIRATGDRGNQNAAVPDLRIGLAVGRIRKNRPVWGRAILDHFRLTPRQALGGMVGVSVGGRHFERSGRRT